MRPVWACEDRGAWAITSPRARGADEARGPTSWELIVMPLSEVAADDEGWEWFRSLPIAGLPEERPTPENRLTIGDVVEALRDSGVRRQFWPAVPGAEPILVGPETQTAGHDQGIGTVSFSVDGREVMEPRAMTDVIKAMFLTKPDPASALRAACVVARHAPLVVFDPDMTGVAITQGASVEDVGSDWPW